MQNIQEETQSLVRELINEGYEYGKALTIARREIENLSSFADEWDRRSERAKGSGYVFPHRVIAKLARMAIANEDDCQTIIMLMANGFYASHIYKYMKGVKK